MVLPHPPAPLRRVGLAGAVALLLVSLPACSGGGGGGGSPTSPQAAIRQICAWSAETGELLAMILEFPGTNNPPFDAPGGCASVSVTQGTVRINATGHWVRTVDAGEAGESGDRFSLVPAETALTNRLVPYLLDGLRRSAGERLADETKLRQRAEVLLGASSDEVAIRAALSNVTRLSDGQLEPPTVDIVASAADFTDSAAFSSFSPKGVTEIEEVYENAGFTAGAKFAYQSGLFRLDRELTHLLWHVYLNPSDHHTSAGVGSLGSKEFDALDDRTFAILFRLRQGSTPETYGLGGEVGTG